jgi:hypothetical protein
MPINFQLREGFIEVDFYGKVTLLDLRQAMSAIIDAESRLAVTPDRITYLSDADFSEFSSMHVVAAAESRRAAPLKNKIKSAIVATQPEQFGLARMFMSLNQNPDTSTMIFKDVTSAHQWLGRPAPL